VQVAANVEDRIEANDDLSVLLVSNYDFATDTGYLALSTDGGVTWSAAENPDGRIGRVYTVLGLSADGTKLLAGESWGRLYIGTAAPVISAFGQLIMVEDGL